ncbi:MAG: hypothetical protein HY738_19840 [Bacteroidia bacterium]|nr:hypothetical protein [Bacteroidia bacterium]
MKRIFTFISLVLLIDFQVNSTVFTVSNTNDSGAGSLREAITFANYTPGSSHTIVFNIPVTDPGYSATSGVWTIHLQFALPYITKSNILL